MAEETASDATATGYVDVGESYRVVLPRKARKLLGIQVGDRFVFSCDGSRITLTPVKVIRQELQAIVGRHNQAKVILSESLLRLRKSKRSVAR